MKSYLTVGRNASFRFTERKSVFIGNIFRTESDEAAAAAIAGVRDMYPDARHNVYAYILRQGNMSRYTDDGEPHGTAGMPVLQVLRGRQLTDCTVVVTRYFGGVLLGTGGLVRAYTEAASGACDAAGTVRMTPCVFVRIRSGYTDYQKIRSIVSRAGGTERGTEYGDSVTAEYSIDSERAGAVLAAVADQTSARATAETVGSGYAELAE